MVGEFQEIGRDLKERGGFIYHSLPREDHLTSRAPERATRIVVRAGLDRAYTSGRRKYRDHAPGI